MTLDPNLLVNCQVNEFKIGRGRRLGAGLVRQFPRQAIVQKIIPVGVNPRNRPGLLNLQDDGVVVRLRMVERANTQEAVQVVPHLGGKAFLVFGPRGRGCVLFRLLQDIRWDGGE